MNGKICITTLEGDRYKGDTFRAVVVAMRQKSFDGMLADGVRGYMRQVSKRIWDWSKKTVRVNSCQQFVRDMAEHGFLGLEVRE